jgi:hypothetical protein
VNLFLLAVPAFFHLVLPLALALWLCSARASSRVEWATVFLALVVYLTVLVVAGAGWTTFGLVARRLVVTGVTLLTARGLCRLRDVPTFRRPHGRSWAVFAVSGALLAFAIPGLPFVLERHDFEGAPVALEFPLRDGRYVIANGGGNEAVNPHAAVPAQRYALDIAKLGLLDTSSSPLAPADVTRYAIFGDAVHSPCSGVALFTRDDLADLVPPAIDPANPAGNHVAVRCDTDAAGGAVTLLLAHLARGSVTVHAGELVRADDLLGRAGNTGNTSGPHLHLQAIRGEAHDVDAFMTGEPVAMLFEGRFLARNDVVEATRASR